MVAFTRPLQEADVETWYIGTDYISDRCVLCWPCRMARVGLGINVFELKYDETDLSMFPIVDVLMAGWLCASFELRCWV